LHYLPSLEYFCVLRQSKSIQLEGHEHYVKQSYRNRCYIRTAHGKERLVVPLTSKHGKVAVKDVRIDHQQKWQNNHWRTIESAYRKAPFFEHYAADLQKILYRQHPFLYDLNLELLSFCLAGLRFSPQVSVSASYEKNPPAGFSDFRSVITPKISPAARPYYQAVPYLQVFGYPFVENLSLIDLLFCTGPQAGAILEASQKEYLNN
jgi:hypothetical protein